jgi:hypothetical protein
MHNGPPERVLRGPLFAAAELKGDAALTTWRSLANQARSPMTQRAMAFPGGSTIPTPEERWEMLLTYVSEELDALGCDPAVVRNASYAEYSLELHTESAEGGGHLKFYVPRGLRLWQLGARAAEIATEFASRTARRPVTPRSVAVTDNSAPAGIVIRFEFSDGTTEEVFGERSMDGFVLAPYHDAICAYRFLQPSVNRFLPWIPVFATELEDVRGALSRKLEILTGGHAVASS